MTKGIKLFLLVLFTAIVAGGVGFLAYEVHSQVSTARTEDSEEKNNTKTSDSSLSDNAQATAGTDDQDTGYILIGDSRFEILCAHNAGVQAVLVEWSEAMHGQAEI